MEHVDDDHLLRHLDEHDEMLPSPGEPKILGQVRIDQATAVLRRRFARGDGRAAGDEVCLVGLGLTRAEGPKRPASDLDERPFRLAA